MSDEELLKKPEPKAPCRLALHVGPQSESVLPETRKTQTEGTRSCSQTEVRVCCACGLHAGYMRAVVLGIGTRPRRARWQAAPKEAPAGGRGAVDYSDIY